MNSREHESAGGSPEAVARAEALVLAALTDATWYDVADRTDWKLRIAGRIAPAIASALQAAHPAERAEAALAGIVPHIEEVTDPLTGARVWSRHLYRVDRHVGPEREAECRRQGGRCALLAWSEEARRDTGGGAERC